MEGYNRFFIVGLLVIGLVGVYAGNRGDLAAQQSQESLPIFDDAAAQPAVEKTTRILKKRSNPHSYPPRSKEGALDLTMKTQREYGREKAREMEQSAGRIWETAEALHLNGRPVNRSPQAGQKQSRSSNSKTSHGEGSSRTQRPGPSHH